VAVLVDGLCFGFLLVCNEGWEERGLTAPDITAWRSLDVKPSRTRVNTLLKISCSGAGDWLGLVIPNAPAAFEIASGILVGVEVGFTAWNSFCTTAGVSVPRRVPFSIASIQSLASTKQTG